MQTMEPPALQQRARAIQLPWLVWLLGFAFLHSLVFVFLMPPWQHYDEPKHFEYVWLAAHLPRWPQPGDEDLHLNRQVVTSMVEYGFFKGLNYTPDLSAPDEKIKIDGYSQLGDPPVYYALASIPLRLFSWFRIDAAITQQLYAARLVSVGLFLLTILAAYGVAREIVPAGNPLRWLLPLCLAALPAFTDLMSSVNNDVAAVAFFSWFLWGSIRLIRQGFSWLNLIWVLASALVCVFTKNTTFVAVPLLGVVLLLASLRGRWQWVGWALLGGAALGLVLAAFSWGDATLWYRNTYQPFTTSLADNRAPWGNHIFRLEKQPGEGKKSGQLIQILPTASAQALQGKTVTLGAWMWASHPMRSRLPLLVVYEGNQVYTQEVTLTEKPAFYSFSAVLKGNPWRSWVILDPWVGTVDPGVIVYYDGLVLAEGSYPAGAGPYFSNASGAVGEWDGQPFRNLLRNPSAESTWYWLLPWADRLGSRIFPDYGQDHLALTLYTLSDLPATRWYYQNVVEGLFRTFWAKFGWANVPLWGGYPYRILAILTSLGFIGAGLLVCRKRKSLPWSIFLFLAIALAAVWGFALIRGSNYIFLRPIFLAMARYAYPVVIPSLLVLLAGWMEGLGQLQRGLRLPGWLPAWVIAGSFLVLDIYSWVSIYHFFSPK